MALGVVKFWHLHRSQCIDLNLMIANTQSQSSTSAADGIADASFEVLMPLKAGKPKAGKKSPRHWPTLSQFDLANPIDLHNCHELLASLGLATRSYESLRQVVLAAILARRLATGNQTGYFAKVLRDGFNHPVTDADHEEAKRTLRTIYDL